MYPLNMALPAPAVGFAVANDEVEHELLSDSGYLPKFEKKPAQVSRDELEAMAEAKGIKVDGRWSDARLQEEIDKA